MSEFRIEFDPPVPPAPHRYSKISLDRLQCDQITRAFSQEYDVIYCIDDKQFRYYPASILTVINDIHWEWEFAKRRESHNMTLSGYTVLDLVFTGEKAQFFDPITPSQSSGKNPVGSEISAGATEVAFKSALDTLLYLIDYDDHETV